MLLFYFSNNILMFDVSPMYDVAVKKLIVSVKSFLECFAFFLWKRLISQLWHIATFITSIRDFSHVPTTHYCNIRENFLELSFLCFPSFANLNKSPTLIISSQSSFGSVPSYLKALKYTSSLKTSSCIQSNSIQFNDLKIIVILRYETIRNWWTCQFLRTVPTLLSR